MSRKAAAEGRGPFRAEHVKPGSHYELSNGHAVWFGPTGGRGSGSNLIGGAVVGFDPDVEEAGVDTGYSWEPGALRAPDVAVGNVPNQAGWVRGAPSLAIEYADTSQDEDELKAKVDELLAAGTRWVWVVRMAGPRRVEVHGPDQPLRTLGPGEELTAPGVLRNPVPVEALYEREAARAALLRNLLQREGYEGLQQVLERGIEQGTAEGGLAEARRNLLRVAARRNIALGEADQARVAACTDKVQIEDWLDVAATASSAAEIFGGK